MIVKDSRRVALVAAALLALTLLGFFVFPGHTFLQSDTQIYIPIFERIENPNLYARDFLLSTAHVGLTVYDETAIALHKLTHAHWRNILAGEQIVFRLLSLLGVFLIATSLGLTDVEALLLAALYGLGATIVGPAVLSVEYEPVPRGFAVAFLLLATGLLMHGRNMWACAFASIGFLYHSPATIPFWIILSLLTVRERNWRVIAPFAIAVAVLALAFATQSGHIRTQSLFSLIDPAWEQVIRMRTAYDWIGQWPAGSIMIFAAYCAAAIAALWRIRRRINVTQCIVLAGFPLLGVVFIGVSWLLLDEWKWALMAQVQPARAALFTIVFAQINCGLAALFASRDRRWMELAAWLILVFLPPVMPSPMNGTWAQAGTAALLVLATVVLLSKAPGRLALPAVALLASWAIPHVARTSNYPVLHSIELDQLSEWARARTSDQALFMFPTAGRSLEQGVFRAQAARGLYTDWKAGGQVNYFRDFALEWSKRWTEISSGRLTADDWKSRGIDYLVYAGPPIEGMAQPAVFRNARFTVYQLSAR